MTTQIEIVVIAAPGTAVRASTQQIAPIAACFEDVLAWHPAWL